MSDPEDSSYTTDVLYLNGMMEAQASTEVSTWILFSDTLKALHYFKLKRKKGTHKTATPTPHENNPTQVIIVATTTQVMSELIVPLISNQLLMDDVVTK